MSWLRGSAPDGRKLHQSPRFLRPDSPNGEANGPGVSVTFEIDNGSGSPIGLDIIA